MIQRWAVKALFRSRFRTAGSILAVAASFALVLTFRAVWEGETEQLAVYIEQSGADVWVMQAHVSNMHMASSFITEGKRNEIARIPGVESLAGILYLNTMVRVGDQQWFSYVVGLDEDGQLGGPWSVPRGSSRIGSGEAVIPQTLSRLTGTGIGDVVWVADRRFTVVGLSEGTFSATNPVNFVHAADLAEVLSLTGYDSYILVEAKPGVNEATLAANILAEVDGVAALPTRNFVENDLQLARQMGTEVIALMTMLCTVLAVLLVGFSLFIHTSHNRRELVILKTLGFSNGRVYGTVLSHAVVLTGLALALAVVAVELLAIFGPRVAPILSLSVSPKALLETGAAGLGVAVVATVLLARRVARVDPMSAFKL